MSGVDFLDTNVLVYLFDRRDARRRAVAEKLLAHALEHDSGVISFQVVQETLNVVTRKISPALSAQDADSMLRSLLVPLWRVMPSAALYARGLGLQEECSLSFYDSLIVAAALEAGCKRLLSEDLQHGQRIEGLRIENPFRA